MNKLTQKQLEMLQLIKKFPSISLTELAKKQSTGVSMIHRRITGLRERGLVRHAVSNSARDLQLTALGELEMVMAQENPNDR